MDFKRVRKSTPRLGLMIGLGVLVVVLSLIGHYSGKEKTTTPLMKNPSVSADESLNSSPVFTRLQTLDSTVGEKLNRRLSTTSPLSLEVGTPVYPKDTITAVSLAQNAWYIGTKTGRVEISLDHKTWRDISQTLPDRTVTSIAQSKTNFGMDVAAVGLAGGPSAKKSGRVFLTLNHGETWIDITGDLPDEVISKIQFQSIGESRELVVELNKHWYGLTDVEGKWRLLP